MIFFELLDSLFFFRVSLFFTCFDRSTKLRFRIRNFPLIFSSVSLITTSPRIKNVVSFVVYLHFQLRLGHSSEFVYVRID